MAGDARNRLIIVLSAALAIGFAVGFTFGLGWAGLKKRHLGAEAAPASAIPGGRASQLKMRETAHISVA
jgi:hypothetical protein